MNSQNYTQQVYPRLKKLCTQYKSDFPRDDFARNMLEEKSMPGVNLQQNFAFARTPSFSPRVITWFEPAIHLKNQYLVSGQLKNKNTCDLDELLTYVHRDSHVKTKSFEIDGLPNFLQNGALPSSHRSSTYKNNTGLKQFACLGKNFILKGLDSFKHLLGINLSGNDHTEVFWSIKLLMVVAHLQNYTIQLAVSQLVSDQSTCIRSANGAIYRAVFTCKGSN